MPEIYATTGDVLISGFLTLMTAGIGIGSLIKGANEALTTGNEDEMVRDFMLGGMATLMSLGLYKMVKDSYNNGQLYLYPEADNEQQACSRAEQTQSNLQQDRPSTAVYGSFNPNNGTLRDRQNSNVPAVEEQYAAYN